MCIYIMLCMCTVYDVVQHAGFRLADNRHENWYVSATFFHVQSLEICRLYHEFTLPNKPQIALP